MDNVLYSIIYISFWKNPALMYLLYLGAINLGHLAMYLLGGPSHARK